MDIKKEFAASRKENGRLRQMLIDIFNELETVQGQVGIVETAVVNSDESTERYIVELSEMITNVMMGINNEVPQYTSMLTNDED